MYLNTPVAVKKGDIIKGSITIAQLESDNRCLKILLTFSINDGTVITKRYTLQ